MKRTKRLLIATTLTFGMYVKRHAQEASSWDYESTKSVMSSAYWSLWNDSVQQRIDQDIEQYRKAGAIVHVPHASPNTVIHIEQISHAFVFGAYIFNFNQLGTSERNRHYKELFDDLFNSVTVLLYWKPSEMQAGRPRYKEEYWDTETVWNTLDKPKEQPHWQRPAPGPIVEFCKNNGIRIQSYTMIWGNRNWQHPQWLIDYAPENERKIIDFWMTPGQNKKYEVLIPKEIQSQIPVYTVVMKNLFDKRVRKLTAYYGSQIDSWDIVNESATDFSLGHMIPGDAIGKSHYGLMLGDYTYETFQLAQNLLPDRALLNIKDYKNDQSYTDQVKDLLQRGCKIDVIGSQMHLFNPQQCLDITAGEPIQSPKQVSATMDTLSQTGLPLHLSEITITAPRNDNNGRQIQAVIIRNLYRLWLSTEKMMGITWWNIADDCSVPDEITTFGLFTRNMEPTPSF